MTITTTSDKTPQEPAMGIYKQNDWGNSKWYGIPCSCGCDNNVQLSIEADDGNVTAHFFATTKTDYWRTKVKVTYDESWLVLNAKLFINDWYNRFAIIWTALTKGYCQTEVYVLMNEQQTINFAHTLINATADMKAFRDETTNNHQSK
jgi:hypothetical protein